MIINIEKTPPLSVLVDMYHIAEKSGDTATMNALGGAIEALGGVVDPLTYGISDTFSFTFNLPNGHPVYADFSPVTLDCLGIGIEDCRSLLDAFEAALIAGGCTRVSNDDRP